MVGHPVGSCWEKECFEHGADVVDAYLAVLGGQIRENSGVTRGPHFLKRLNFEQVASDLGMALA
ncbi:MAG: hypothetical protein CL877_01465 [Dehalococcoidales bacterium]|nr:hypothetical protein [Dehalococcoidales bacterium]